MIYLGNSKLGSLYLGSTKISEAYIGSTKIFSSVPVQYPYLLMEFSSGYTPSTNLLYSEYRNYCEWIQVSSSPNVWKLEIHAWRAPQEQMGWGIPVLFCSATDGASSYLSSVPCKLVGGDLSIPINGVYCQSMDRTFSMATGLTEISDIIQCTTLVNVGGAFNGCTNCAYGQYDLYSYLSTYNLDITNHSGTFTNCGSNTQEGQDELAQIPVGWGGTLVPASTLMTSAVTNQFGTLTTWRITGNAPDWEDIIGLYLFTEASVSSYAGVSMNRSRITKRNGLGTATKTDALYFYPAFTQYSGTSSSNRVITWVATTDMPNGSLAVGQGNTDMPGTLDYSTYGPITREYGTYYPSNDVYFLFLVTNVPIANWAGLTDAYGVLYNSNFKNDGGFRYFY